MKIQLALACLLIPAVVSAQPYSGECGECVHRKQRLCADECELVKGSKGRKCQYQCIAEYCVHKCEKTAPELEAYLHEGCDDCLDHQYELCEVQCTVGQPRERAPERAADAAREADEP